jgi:4-diphosphocytidyl-2-C-methyl-D-erythritol kinase
MTLELSSPCKVNLLLNILGRRPDGFHELETVLQPVPLCDTLRFARKGSGVQLTCSAPGLPVDAGNLVHRAATAFLTEARIHEGVTIHLQKNLPIAAGLGAGSANAAVTLLGLNQLFDQPLALAQLHVIAASLGSDVPFFLQPNPALGTGRGECIQPLDPFPALQGKGLLLFRPGFGVSTPWAYQHLGRFPDALNGQPGRASRLVTLLNQRGDAAFAERAFYNSLEAPVFPKYPLLAGLKEFVLRQGALMALMSGSGSTLFAITENEPQARMLLEQLRPDYGDGNWTATVTL